MWVNRLPLIKNRCCEYQFSSSKVLAIKHQQYNNGIRQFLLIPYAIVEDFSDLAITRWRITAFFVDGDFGYVKGHQEQSEEKVISHKKYW